jgi:hypothetical protein
MSKNTLPLTASGQAKYSADQSVIGVGQVAGIIVCSHTSGTIKLVDSPNSQTGRIILDTWTLAAGPQVITFPKPLDFYEGVNVAVGGTVNIELVIDPTS